MHATDQEIQPFLMYERLRSPILSSATAMMSLLEGHRTVAGIFGIGDLWYKGT